MYEELSDLEKAMSYFGNRVDIICAMEMGNRIDVETAYKLIKEELKRFKKIRKKYKNNSGE